MLRPALAALLLSTVLAAPAPAYAEAEGAPRTHVVQNGQRLQSIAKRYQVTIEAICFANDIGERQIIKPGQRLVIPSTKDKDGSQARAQNTNLRRAAEAPTRTASLSTLKPGARRTKEPAWRDYARKPPRKGFLNVASHNAKWRGLAIDSKGRLRPIARQGIANLLGATGDHPGAPERLLKLLVQVSDTFGGRPLYIVSGYRTTSHFRDSRHKTSQAIDFSVTGVPNSVVRDYLRTLDNVGVGYYPNSSFLHLDVRPTTTFWIDYAGPGEAPRKTPRGHVVATPTDVDDAAEEEAEGTTTPAAPAEVRPADAAPSLPAATTEQAERPRTEATLPNRSAGQAAAPRP
jgi:LysM repeat protein